MASSFSIVKTYGNYIEPYDFGLLAKGLEYKQGKHDKATGELQSKIDKIANLDMVRTVDKKYLGDKIEGVLSDINRFGSVDLANSNVERAISANIGTVIDQKVMNAYVSSQNFRKYQKEVATIKKESPELYSEQNEMYGMRGVEKWIEDPEAGAAYSGGQYTPYTDVNGKLSKVMNDMVKNKSEQTVQIPTGDGRIVQKKIKEMSAAEIEKVALGTLNSQDKKQLRIDGWHNWGKVDQATSEGYLNKHLANKNKNFDANIAIIDTQIAGATTPEEKKQLQEQRKVYESQKNEYNVSVNNMNKNPEEIGAFLEQEALLSNMTNRFGFKNVDIEYKSDEAFWKSSEFNYKVKKDERTHELNVAKYELDVAKFQAEAAESSGAGGVGMAGAVQTVSPIDTDSSKSSEDILYDKIDEGRKVKATQINSIVTGWDAKTQDDFQKTVEATKTAYPDMSEERVVETAFDKVTKGMSNNLVSKKQRYQLQEVDDQIKQNMGVINQAVAETSKIDNKAGNEFFDIVKTKPNIKDVNGVPYAQKWQGKEYYQLSAQEKSEFNAHIHADTAISGFTEGYGQKGSTGLGGKWNRRDDPNAFYRDNGTWESSKPSLKYSIEASSAELGENLAFEDIFKVEDVKHGIGNEIVTRGISTLTGAFTYPDYDNPEGRTAQKKITLNPKAKGTKTYALFENMIKNQAYDTSSGFRDDSFQDVSRIRSRVSYDAVRKGYTKRLDNAREKDPSNRTTTFAAKTSGHQKLSGMATKLDGFKVTASTPIGIRPDPVDPNSFIIFQNIVKKGKQVPVSTPISKEELIDNGFGSVINFDNSAAKFRPENMQPKTETVTFMTENDEDIDFVFDELQNTGNAGLQDFVTAQSTENYFNDKYSHFYGTGADGKLIKDVVDYYVANPNSSKMVVAPSKDKSHIRMSMQDNAGNVMVSKNIGTEFDEHYKPFTLAPQAYSGKFMEDMVQEGYNQSQTYGNISPNSNIYKYAKAHGIR